MKRFLTGWVLVACWAVAGWAQDAALVSTATLQDMIDMTEPGGEVLVEPGVYHGTLVLRDGVTLRSTDGDAVTIIDGQGAETVVAFGKESALIGFTLRNGNVLVASKGHFIGLFECTLESFQRFGIFFEGGSGVVAHNLIRGNERSVGIFCFSANPLIINNVIEDNHIGFQWHPHLIPSLIGNLFRNNHVALYGASADTIVLQGNLFDGNATVASFGELPAGNEIRAIAPNEFVLARGQPTSLYRDLMDTTYEAAVKDHPIIVYDLHDEPGVFDAVTLFPWATFTVSASAIDTRIDTHEAYDWVADRALHSELIREADQRPAVRVNNPEILEKMRERYVLESRYTHPASYVKEPDGRLVFRRMTNLAQIEVVAPIGYTVLESTPPGVVNEGGDRVFVSIHDIGVTHVEVILVPRAR
ncbi:MAG TPA: right-handed parallel beta-helix repeat-containing protein [Kiritimatiellia bacterium]|nr:right-handed parallel beta-helix repeat-containing protein [Kiritimatiellia bacterium]